MTKKHDKTLDKIIELANQDPEICILWLYGSRAKGTATPSSDYDLAVAFTHVLKQPLERRLRPELLAIDWLQQLSLTDDDLSIVDINSAPIHLSAEIIRTGTLLLNKDPLRLYREQNRIYGMLELDSPYGSQTTRQHA